MDEFSKDLTARLQEIRCQTNMIAIKGRELQNTTPLLPWGRKKNAPMAQVYIEPGQGH